MTNPDPPVPPIVAKAAELFQARRLEFHTPTEPHRLWAREERIEETNKNEPGPPLVGETAGPGSKRFGNQDGSQERNETQEQEADFRRARGGSHQTHTHAPSVPHARVVG